MAQSILVVGATGNTGRGVVETLSNLLQNSSNSQEYRIIALTRTSNSAAAQQLSKLPRVEVVEKLWTDISSEWLRASKVARAFVASHNLPTQFAEESSFLVAALRANVKYVVRISTTAANVHPDCEAYYPRTHWAIEALLSSPEFKNLHWTSLQPNIFSSMYLSPAAKYIKSVREGEQPASLLLMASEDAPVGIIDPFEVGVLAAHLLLEPETDSHNKAKYVLNGPVDITGRQVVDLVESYIGGKVDDVKYKDVSFIDAMAADIPESESKSLILSIKHALETAWAGMCTASTTSQEVLKIAAPKRTPTEALATLLK